MVSLTEAPLNRILTAGAAALALLTAGTAAVDVTNQDQESHHLFVVIDDHVGLITVPAGQTLNLICAKCLVSLDDDNDTGVAGNQVAVIRNGKLTVQ